MAESKRRGEDAVDKHLDEVFVDAVDDDAQDDFADEFDDDEPGTAISGRRNASTATKVKADGDAKVAVKPASTSTGLYGRIARFIREVVAELQKVNWPSRNELITYATVVIIFVVIMMLIVAGLDWVFAWGVTHVFG